MQEFIFTNQVQHVFLTALMESGKIQVDTHAMHVLKVV